MWVWFAIGILDEVVFNEVGNQVTLVKYFDNQGIQWQVKTEIRKSIRFQQFNLIGKWTTLPPMDIIFMRNVLIYFDADTKQQVFGKLRQQLRPDGYLFLGGAETTVNLDSTYKIINVDKTACFQLG